jgi:diaminopimelate decarboxylase
MDVVSGGELHRAVLAGTPTSKIVYAGVGKTDVEIRQALQANIGWFNIESEGEFENIAAIARQMGKRARGALRINPDVADPKTHQKTMTGQKESKFGVDIDRARTFFARYGRDEHLELSAIHLHLGSPIYSAEPYVRALHKALALVDELKARGQEVRTIDIGGGFMAEYQAGDGRGREPTTWDDYAREIVPLLVPFVRGGGQVIIEPGRTISANAGALVTRVQYVKTGGRKTFVIVDAGMHTLVRPALYDAYHFIWPTRVAPSQVPTSRVERPDLPDLAPVDIVGPICESSDCLAKERAIPKVARGDLLCVFSAGAYGMVMASQYNATPRPPEVLVDGDQATIIRRRETYDDLVAAESETSPVRL